MTPLSKLAPLRAQLPTLSPRPCVHVTCTKGHRKRPRCASPRPPQTSPPRTPAPPHPPYPHPVTHAPTMTCTYTCTDTRPYTRTCLIQDRRSHSVPKFSTPALMPHPYPGLQPGRARHLHQRLELMQEHLPPREPCAHGSCNSLFRHEIQDCHHHKAQSNGEPAGLGYTTRVPIKM